MSISMQQIDSCIETTINRLSSEAGTMVSNFYLDLRSPGRQRITEKLVVKRRTKNAKAFHDKCENG